MDQTTSPNKGGAKQQPARSAAVATPVRIQIDIPRKFYLAVIIVLVIPYLVVVGILVAHSNAFAKFVRQHAPSSASPVTFNSTEKPVASKPGPWGNLEYTQMFLEIPEEFLSVRADETADRRWFFGGFSREKLSDFFNQLGLPAEQRQQLFNAAKWEPCEKGVYVTPPKELVLNLAPGTRERIYSLLVRFPENSWQREAFVFPEPAFSDYFAAGGLSAETVALVRKLCYPHGKVLLFADMPYVLDTLPSYDDKLRLEKAASRRSTLLMKLRITPESNVAVLLSYWGRAGMDKDLRPLMESLGKVPGGALIGLNNLLPPFPRSRMYRFPFPSLNQPENCHWTSFNFFKEKPEGKFDRPEELKSKIEAEYYPVFSDPKYGDIVFLVKPGGEIVHSAVFIADDIVFTKNGGHFTAPWLLMSIPDLVESYSAFVPADQPLQVMYYRNKYY